MKKFILFLIISGLCFRSESSQTEFKAIDLMTGKPIQFNLKNSNSNSNSKSKNSVLVFLSARCPCSHSHIALLQKLSEKYSNFNFIGIHSNPEESLSESQKYFEKAKLQFQIIQDQKTQLADHFKAFKTPHAFIVSPEAEILYQGGVTNSAHADSATRQYLAEALEDLQNNREVKTKEGRTLGCVISRENEKNIL